MLIFLGSLRGEKAEGLCSVVHRADYHTILFDEAVRLGLKIRLNSKASAVDFEMPSVTLTTGEEVFADVVVGADGKSRRKDSRHGTGY